MTQTIAHFVFTLSGAGCLVQALRKAGRDDQVVSSWHGLNAGPIDPSDPLARTKWFEKELGRIDRRDGAPSERDWDETRFPGHRKVAWLTRRSAMEYAGFLDWLWHRGDTPCDVVDLSEIKISHRQEDGSSRAPTLAMSLGWLHPDTICRDKLWDLAEPLQTSERLRYRELWGQLLSENAPLRVIEGGKLVSAPITFFDTVLMACVTHDWQLGSRIIGNTMASELDVIGTDFDLLQARLMALIESGRLEIKERYSLEKMHLGQIRLARKE